MGKNEEADRFLTVITGGWWLSRGFWCTVIETLLRMRRKDSIAGFACSEEDSDRARGQHFSRYKFDLGRRKARPKMGVLLRVDHVANVPKVYVESNILNHR